MFIQGEATESADLPRTATATMQQTPKQKQIKRVANPVGKGQHINHLTLQGDGDLNCWPGGRPE